MHKLLLILLKLILSAILAILTSHAPASHHRGQTFRMEIQALSVQNHAHRWHWIIEGKDNLARLR